MDGLGGYQNSVDSFTLLVNHELPVSISSGVATGDGIVREHFAAGAFVSH